MRSPPALGWSDYDGEFIRINVDLGDATTAVSPGPASTLRKIVVGITSNTACLKFARNASLRLYETSGVAAGN